MAELSHPLIATNQLPNAIESHFYKAQIVTSASIGHLVSADENGLPYQMKFRTGDDLVFNITGAPAGLSIDNQGVISGFVGDVRASKYEVTIDVKNSRNGASDSIKLSLTVMGR